jgi:hypothetical protein
MTIPGFTPIEVEPQAHIHLGLVPRSGSPSGFGSHNEPPYTFRHIEKRIPHFEGQYEFVNAIDGTPADHTPLHPTTGDALVKTDYQYTIRVSATEEQILIRLLHNRVYLVDSRHCPDNQDHAPYTKIMAFAELAYNSNYDPQLKFNQITLTFKDMDTVAGL